VKDSKKDIQPHLNHELLKHEKPGRGVVAYFLETGKRVFWGEGSFDEQKQKVYIGWRLLASDPSSVAFDVYRQVDDGSPVRINEKPVVNSTNFIDGDVPSGEKFTYIVKSITDRKEESTSRSYSFTRSGQPNPYISIKLKGNYDFSKIAIADLDGDGEYDYVIKHPEGNVDPWYLYWKPSPGTISLEAYKSTGEPMWTYDMGWAIEQGIWYSPYLAYDFNGDGHAEIAVKSGEQDPRDKEGKVQTGPEYLSILDGQTGKQIAQDAWIPREPFYEINKQYAYNYASRNQLAVAYLDGVHPHVIVLRGTYNLMIVRAYRLEGNELKLAWDWDNRKAPKSYWGQGGHWTWAADVDKDGCDELILGSCALDHDGKELWSTGMGHNDEAYVADLIPSRPGLEIYYGMEASQTKGNGMCMVDSRTGEIIWGIDFPTHHVSPGFCSDIDRVYPGRECYSVETVNFEGKRTNFALMHSSEGKIINQSLMPASESVFWDTDNQRELLGRGRIFEYNGSTVFDTQVEGRVITVADFLGDWREEIITSLPGELRIYSTPILADTRHTCLMQDPIYRSNVAHISQGYNQIPMTTYDIPFQSSNF
jgi:hypothetical protein